MRFALKGRGFKPRRKFQLNHQQRVPHFSLPLREVGYCAEG